VLTNVPATFSVAAWSALPMSYQWQKGTFTGNMTDIEGATESTYTTPPTTLVDHLTLLRCVVSNPVGSVTSAAEMLFVTADVKPPTDIISPINVSAQAGAPFAYTIRSSGGTTPITYSAVGLPAGLSLDSDSGRISGIPTETGASSIAIGASNSAGNASAILTLKVTLTAPVISLDAWRSSRFGASATDPSIAGDLADPDGDGYTNLDEFKSGTDPLDSTSVPIPSAAPGVLVAGP
jgi:hypothetical protein